MGETLEEIQPPVSPTMAVHSDSEESTESTLGLGPGLSGMDLSGDAEGRVGDPRTAERVGSEGETQENADGEFSCRWGTCTESFSHVDLLASHVTCVHATSGEGGLFYCGWRGCSRGKRGFNARYKMLIHVRTHTNEKPHRCPRCDKSFSRAENLKIHARSHTGERPYVCPVPGCGKAYSNSSDRFKHTRTHSVERPYACRVPGCSKRYTDPSSLRKHVKTYAHYHRPGVEENSKTSPAEEKNCNKPNLREMSQDKTVSILNVPAKVADRGKIINCSIALEEEKNPKNQTSNNRKINSSLPVTIQYHEDRIPSIKIQTKEEAMETDYTTERLTKKEFGLKTNKSLDGGRLQPPYIKGGSPSSWNAVPDDKWLENDIEEVEEDEEEVSIQGDLQSQESLEMKDAHYLSNEVAHEQFRYPTSIADSEWSSGGEEGWVSDENDFMQNGMHQVLGLPSNYMNFTSKVPHPNHRSYYLAEKQLISKLSKKNYILSRSCQKRLDALLLRSLPKFGPSNLEMIKKHSYHVNSFQPMDYSPSALCHQSRVVYKDDLSLNSVEKCKNMFNEMAYHSIQYEQVVPLDLRKINQ